jgi:hypothetical protein
VVQRQAEQARHQLGRLAERIEKERRAHVEPSATDQDPGVAQHTRFACVRLPTHHSFPASSSTASGNRASYVTQRFSESASCTLRSSSFRTCRAFSSSKSRIWPSLLFSSRWTYQRALLNQIKTGNKSVTAFARGDAAAKTFLSEASNCQIDENEKRSPGHMTRIDSRERRSQGQGKQYREAKRYCHGRTSCAEHSCPKPATSARISFLWFLSQKCN